MILSYLFGKRSRRLRKKFMAPARLIMHLQQRKQLTRLRESWAMAILPICMAKNQYSLSDDPKKLGRPEGFEID